jgi:glycosyltransferase involved in cell wall biosynthesis
LAVDDMFINHKLNSVIDKEQSIFTSRPDRNLDLLLDIWNEDIFPNFKTGKLLVTKPDKKIDQKNNIVIRELDTQEKMLKSLSMSKIFLVPGHKAELFCLAAEEANELCIPTVTLGIGCLSERVQHGKTGFVAKNNKEFSKFVLDIYKNENLWNELRKNLINKRGAYKWIDAAKEFISKI